jgi:predicted MPP superfamily phosphohydrolase
MVQPDTRYRTPIPPRPVERFDLAHEAVPGALEGLTILHVSDLHVRRDLVRTDRYAMILNALARTECDIIALTGDLMDEPGHERDALHTLAAMAGVWRARLGVFGVFGNHDTPEFQRAAAREFGGEGRSRIDWIGGRHVDLAIGGANLRLIGLDWPEDVLGYFLDAPPPPRPPAAAAGSMGIALAHHPTSLIPAAELGIPILLAGHTHAGQVRVHARMSPHTSSDLPMHHASGMLRLGGTVACISRGLGDGVVEGFRVNCPRQMPLYTLRRGAAGAGGAGHVTQVVAW